MIAQGGFSGLFPSSTLSAYQLAQITGLAGIVLWCDVRLTKDGVGICSASLKLENTTNIQTIFPRGEKSYLVNGVPTKGFFPIDFTHDQLENVSGKVLLFRHVLLYHSSSVLQCLIIRS